MAQTLKFFLALITAGLIGCKDARLPIDAPNIQSQPPIIYLAANLDEEQRLGWCIDTKGRGFSEALHAHSCKPQSADAQDSDINFRFDASTGQIQSTGFAGKCAERTPNGPTDLGLFDCDPTNTAQRFLYDAGAQALKTAPDSALCLAAAPEITEAGPFQSRALLLQDCGPIGPAYKQWVILE